MRPINLSEEPETARQAAKRVCAEAGVNPADCYQCGKCAAGCPVSESADISCRQVIRLIQLGEFDAAVTARMPWLCVACGTCLARCPQSVDLPALNAALCREATRRGCAAVKEGPLFTDIFLDNVQKRGVMDETMLAARFNLSSGHLFQDAAGAPTMMSHGLLSGDGYRPSDAAEVGAMIERLRAQAHAAESNADQGKEAQCR